MKTLQEIIGERVAFGAWSVYEDELKAIFPEVSVSVDGMKISL